MDLLLCRTKHDLVFENGKCPTTTDSIDSVIQRLYIRLRTFMGEWYLNVEYGVPWLEKVLGHKVKKTTVDMTIQKEILDVEGVARVTHFESWYDNTTRAYRCKFKVQATNGQRSDFLTLSSDDVMRG